MTASPPGPSVEKDVRARKSNRNSSRSRVPVRGCVAAAAAACALLGLAGCNANHESSTGGLTAGSQRTTEESSGSGNQQSTRDTDGTTDDRWAAFDLGAPGANAQAGGEAAGDDAAGLWTIALATFTSARHAQMAQEIRDDIINASGLRDVRVDTNANRSILHYGRYASPTGDRLNQDLDRIQAIEIAGRQPFSRAFATIIDPSEEGSLPQFNLTRLWEMFPRAERIYSLQIGFYDFDDAASEQRAREAAEELVARLRQEGQPAFYYHGPRMSVVTVGIFFEEAFDPVLGYSRAVKELREEYPHNLANGRELIQTSRYASGEERTNVQESFLIEVPRQ